MFLVRELMYCKPGKVRAMVDKFRALNKVVQTHGYKPFRLSTDVSGERFWTIVIESEVQSLSDYQAMEEKVMADPEAGKAMEGYHDLVESGRRELYRVES